jgi:hypothetical protein
MPTWREVRRIERRRPTGYATPGHIWVRCGNVGSREPRRAIRYEGAVDVDRHRLNAGFRKSPSGYIHLPRDPLAAHGDIDAAEGKLRSGSAFRTWRAPTRCERNAQEDNQACARTEPRTNGQAIIHVPGYRTMPCERLLADGRSAAADGTNGAISISPPQANRVTIQTTIIV